MSANRMCPMDFLHSFVDNFEDLRSFARLLRINPILPILNNPPYGTPKWVHLVPNQGLLWVKLEEWVNGNLINDNWTLVKPIIITKWYHREGTRTLLDLLAMNFDRQAFVQGTFQRSSSQGEMAIPTKSQQNNYQANCQSNYQSNYQLAFWPPGSSVLILGKTNLLDNPVRRWQHKTCWSKSRRSLDCLEPLEDFFRFRCLWPISQILGQGICTHLPPAAQEGKPWLVFLACGHCGHDLPADFIWFAVKDAKVKLVGRCP